MSSFKVSACVATHIGDRHEQQDRVAIITSERNTGAMLAIVSGLIFFFIGLVASQLSSMRLGELSARRRKQP